MKPILLNRASVIAILSGRKTQMRHIIKPQPPWGCEYVINGAFSHVLCFATGTHRTGTPICVPPTPKSIDHRMPCRFVPGDRLWVREAFAILRVRGAPDDYEIDELRGPVPVELPAGYGVVYAAGDTSGNMQEDRGFSWRPSVHMPRWASRITLEVTGVRVQRVQEIGEADAAAEGVNPTVIGFERPYAFAFADFWECINKSGSAWRSNPWVQVTEFKADWRKK